MPIYILSQSKLCIPSPRMDSAAWWVVQRNLKKPSMKKTSFRSGGNVSCVLISVVSDGEKNGTTWEQQDIFLLLPNSVPTSPHCCSGRLKVSRNGLIITVSNANKNPPVLIPPNWLDKDRLTSHSCNIQCKIQRLKRLYTEHKHCFDWWRSVSPHISLASCRLIM